MIRLFKKFTKSESGATAIEYGMICTFIALVIIVSIASIGSSLNGIFAQVQAGF